jgi:hypothetical protein
MPATYEPIATTTLGSSASSITFSSISSTYTDLILVVNAKATTGDYLRYRVGNGSIDTGSNYSQTMLDSQFGSYRYSNISTPNLLVSSLVPTSDFSISIAHFQNYSNTSTYKTILHRGNKGGVAVETGVTLWRSTSAINTIQILIDTSLAAGTNATLYGIKAA